ncbi:MAG: thiosulfate oxidation carrier protein SoxY [Gammaproteobacteria bacterium]
MKRRKFLQRSLFAAFSAFMSSVGVAFAESVSRLWPERPRGAFSQQTLEPTFASLFGETEIINSDKIRILAADLAENGAVVPVKVETDFETAKSITLVASKNPVPLVAQFNFSERVVPFVATRIKLAESSEIIAVVETNGGLYQARRFVDVTIGGCGA